MTAAGRRLHAVPVPDPDAQLAERAAEIAADLTARGRTFVVAAHAPITAACATCQAPPSAPCRSPRGWSPRGGFHTPRMRSVAHLTDVEKVAAYARMKAKHEQVRNAPLPPLTGEQLATRRAIGAAFLALEERQHAEEQAMRARCRDPWVHRVGCTCRQEER